MRVILCSANSRTLSFSPHSPSGPSLSLPPPPSQSVLPYLLQLALLSSFSLSLLLPLHNTGAPAGCRPCNLVLTCACDEPPEQRFPAIAANANASAAAGGLPPPLLPRYNYSYAAYTAAQAAVGGDGGASLSRRAWCGDPVARECWACPESTSLDFPDPIRTLARWRAAPFCERCLASPCICGGIGGTAACPLDFRAQWEIRD
jgi:hypothetical protein